MLKRAFCMFLFILVVSNMLVLASRTQATERNGIIYIRADGSIDPPTATIATLDNLTYVVSENLNESVGIERSNIVLDGQSHVLRGNMSDVNVGVSLISVRNVTIQNLDIRDFSVGIDANGAHNNRMCDNTISGAYIGIELGWSGGLAFGEVIEGNDFKCYSGAIWVNGDGVVIVKNKIVIYGGSGGMAIWLRGSYSNVSLNSITTSEEVPGSGAADGIVIGLETLVVARNNSVCGNRIFGCGKAISLGVFGCQYNEVFDNRIENNAIGVYVSGDYAYNRVYHNKFLFNARQTYVTWGEEGIWDDGYSSGGNYWSDYNGIDLYSGARQNATGSDGIGDTPYVIDEANIDRYPLMVHDLAIYDVETPKNIVCQGYSVSVQVAVVNEGSYTENSNVTLYVGADDLLNQSLTIKKGSLTTMDFVWNTSEYSQGNYTLMGLVYPIVGETELGDNYATGKWILLSMVGDVTGQDGYPDGRVDMKDVSYEARRFLCLRSDPLWDPNADVNGDNKIDMKDIGPVARYFGKHYP